MDKTLEKIRKRVVTLTMKSYEDLKSKGKLEKDKVYFVTFDRRCES